LNFYCISWPEFDTWQGKDIILFAASILALWLMQPPIQQAPGTLSLGVKRPWHEAGHSPLSTAEVKNGGTIPPLTHTASWHGPELIMDRDKFTYTIYLFLVISSLKFEITWTHSQDNLEES
jgi:hypothetical protein